VNLRTSRFSKIVFSLFQQITVKIDDGGDGDDDSEDGDDDDDDGFMRIAMLLMDTVMHSIKKCKLPLGYGLMSPASLKKILGSRR